MSTIYVINFLSHFTLVIDHYLQTAIGVTLLHDTIVKTFDNLLATSPHIFHSHLPRIYATHNCTQHASSNINNLSSRTVMHDVETQFSCTSSRVLLALYPSV